MKNAAWMDINADVIRSALLLPDDVEIIGSSDGCYGMVRLLIDGEKIPQGAKFVVPIFRTSGGEVRFDRFEKCA